MWPRYAILAGSALSVQPLPPSRKRRSGRSAATFVKYSPIRRSRSGSRLAISRDHRWSAAIGQYEVVGRDHRSEWVVTVAGNAVERRWCVHIPEGGNRSGALDRRHARLEQGVEDADAARLDNQVGGPCLVERKLDASLILGWVDNDLRPIRVGDIPVCLTV